MYEKMKDGYKIAFIRGATTSSGNSIREIEVAVVELIDELISRNNLIKTNILSITFTATKDLDACFPASIARKFNLKTRLGAILDPLSDKVFYLIPLTFLCKNNFIPFWSLSLILFRELIISSLRNSTKDGLPASTLGKYKTFFFFISVITFFTPLKNSLLNNFALIFYWLGFILTFVTLLSYLRIKKNII